MHLQFWREFGPPSWILTRGKRRSTSALSPVDSSWSKHTLHVEILFLSKLQSEICALAVSAGIVAAILDLCHVGQLPVCHYSIPRGRKHTFTRLNFVSV